MADTVLRPATITRIPRPASDAAINSQEWVWTNGLLGLFTPAATPFAQLDWPNPLPQRLNLSLAMIENMLENTLAPPAAGSTAAIWLRRRRRQED